MSALGGRRSSADRSAANVKLRSLGQPPGLTTEHLDSCLADHQRRLEIALMVQMKGINGALEKLTAAQRQQSINLSAMVTSLANLEKRVDGGGGGGGGGMTLGSRDTHQLHEQVESGKEVAQLLAEDHSLLSMLERVRHEQVKAASRRSRPEMSAVSNAYRVSPLPADHGGDGHFSSHAFATSPFPQRVRRAATNRSPRGLLCAAARVLRHGTFDPNSRFRGAWDLTLLLLVAYSALMMPLQIAFEGEMGAVAHGIVVSFWAFMDVFFLLDLLVNFRTAFHVEGVLVRNTKVIAERYVRGWFLVDLVASAPFALVAVCLPDQDTTAWALTRLLRALRIFKLIKVLKVLRMPQGIEEVLEERLRFNPALLRLLRLVVALLLCCHWLGCSWWYVGVVHGEGLSAWAAPHALLDGAPASHKYFYSFYWALGMLTFSLPMDILPETELEVIFSILSLALGLIMSAMVISSATSALSNLDAAAESHRRELDAINGYMRFKRVPMDLRRRLNHYFNFVFSTKQFMESSPTLTDLPPQLRVQLLLAANMRTLAGVPIFKHCDNQVMIQVVQRMKSAIYCPEEFIVRQGNTPKGLFLITRGVVSATERRAASPSKRWQLAAESIIKAGAKAGGGAPGAAARPGSCSAQSLAAWGKMPNALRKVPSLHDRRPSRAEHEQTDRVLRQLSDNDFFGEDALISREASSCSYRSVIYTDMSVLLRDDFLQLVDGSSELAAAIRASAQGQSVPMETARLQGRRGSFMSASLAALASVTRSEARPSLLPPAAPSERHAGCGPVNEASGSSETTPAGDESLSRASSAGNKAQMAPPARSRRRSISKDSFAELAREIPKGLGRRKSLDAGSRRATAPAITLRQLPRRVSSAGDLKEQTGVAKGMPIGEDDEEGEEMCTHHQGEADAPSDTSREQSPWWMRNGGACSKRVSLSPAISRKPSGGRPDMKPELEGNEKTPSRVASTLSLGQCSSNDSNPSQSLGGSFFIPGSAAATQPSGGPSDSPIQPSGPKEEDELDDAQAAPWTPEFTGRNDSATPPPPVEAVAA